MEKKDQTLGFKVSVSMKEKAAWVERKTSIAFTDILRLAAGLVINYVEEHGQITMPFTLIPEQELSALRKRLAVYETPGASSSRRQRQRRVGA